jgi:hypothetical protein
MTHSRPTLFCLRGAASAWWCCIVAGVIGCASDVEIGRDFAAAADGGESGTAGSGGSSAGRAGAGAGAGATAGAGAAACEVAHCGNRAEPYRCGNCLDDDNDGVIDAADGHCLGPCDDSEDSYLLDLPGDAGAPCRQDCYFDQNAGPGNDGCYWSHACDPLSIAPDYPPSADARCAFDEDTTVPGTNASCGELATTQADACLSSCGPLTPNGCDCFGCCELPAGSGIHVFIGSTLDGQGSCREDTLGDPSACQRCTPVSGCANPCDPCEVCAGRPEPIASCSGGNGQCESAQASCGRPGQSACSPGEYCITGCCVVEPR